MRVYLTIGAVAVASLSQAGVYFYNGALTPNSPTFDNPGGSVVGTAVQHYHFLEFSVDTSGAYTFETASPNTSGTPSNALDTYLNLYGGSFNPLAPATGWLIGNDDFTGTLTVLPGPYAGTISSTATGFTGAQPSSRLLNVNLTAGTSYFLINSSFRSTDFIQTGTNGGPTGPYYTGISGPGNINPVPEPASMIALGLGAAALLRRRRKQ